MGFTCAVLCAAALALPLISIGSASLAASKTAVAAKQPVTLVPSVPIVRDQPQFEFKGVVAGQTANTTALKCYPPDRDGSVTCETGETNLAGVASFMSPTFKFYAGKLYSLDWGFGIDNFPTIRSAMTAKYGQPCSTDQPKWQNEAGATFDNLTVTWCFATGKLKLSAMGFRRDVSDLEYIDSVNIPPGEKPKVDF